MGPDPDDPEWAMLAFAAEHRFVIPAQLAAAAQITLDSAERRAQTLIDSGQLTHSRPLTDCPPLIQITLAGLRAIASALPKPRKVSLSLYRHDVGLGWLMLIARRGRFGPVRAVIGEREMRSRDARRAVEIARAKPVGQPLGVRLAGEGPAGGDRLHYPDLLLVTPRGRHVAIELELTGKASRRREQILSAYSLDPRIDAVLYLVDTPSTGAALSRSARRLGLSGLIHVQSVEFPGATRRETPPRSRQRSRGPRLARGRGDGGARQVGAVPGVAGDRSGGAGR